MGFYPVCPATTQYVLGAPLFEEVTLTLENGKTFEISASNNDVHNRYVRTAKLNGLAYDKNWISHTELNRGGRLTFEMSTVPNKKRGSKKSAYPYSLSDER
jgi:putative alpha-1,2-mannosidase